MPSMDDPMQAAFLVLVIVSMAAFAFTLMGASIYTGMGKKPPPVAPADERKPRTRSF